MQVIFNKASSARVHTTDTLTDDLDVKLEIAEKKNRCTEIAIVKYDSTVHLYCAEVHLKWSKVLLLPDLTGYGLLT